MSNNPPSNELALSQQAVLDIIQKQQQIDKVQALAKILEITQQKIKIVGEEFDILNLELLTEYSNAKTTQYMVKHETWRKSVQEVYHMKDINEEKQVGYMLEQVKLKMTSHRRKRVTEYINGLKNDIATAEVIPQNTKKKKFFGMM